MVTYAKRPIWAHTSTEQLIGIYQLIAEHGCTPWIIAVCWLKMLLCYTNLTYALGPHFRIYYSRPKLIMKTVFKFKTSKLWQKRALCAKVGSNNTKCQLLHEWGFSYFRQLLPLDIEGCCNHNVSLSVRLWTKCCEHDNFFIFHPIFMKLSGYLLNN